jgi:hypothetical protein
MSIDEIQLKQKAQEYYEKDLSYNQVYIQGYSDGYNKAINEFANTLIPRLTDAIYPKDIESMTNLINDVARELKAGGENG